MALDNASIGDADLTGGVRAIGTVGAVLLDYSRPVRSGLEAFAGRHAR